MYIIHDMKMSMLPKPKKPSAMVGTIQCTRYAVDQPKRKSPMTLHGPPIMASGRRFSGGIRDVANDGLGSSWATASCTRGLYYFLLKRRMVIAAMMTPAPRPRNVRPVERLLKPYSVSKTYGNAAKNA